MARHAYWSGQIKIALVYLPVSVVNATQTSQQIDLDQIHAPTGERVHYAKVLENGDPVDKDDIVKGYKTDSGDYVLLEQAEIDKVKLPSSDVLELIQFVDVKAIPLPHFEKPFFIVPEGKGAEEIYVTIRDALKKTGKAGLGKLAVRGREELCAVLPYENGLILETLRYEQELKSADEYFGKIKGKADAENMHMAEELIKKRTAPLKLEKFEDTYHDALMELINSKQEKRKPHYQTAAKKPKNVINLMDALRKSLHGVDKADKKKVTKKAKPKTAAKRKKAA